LRNVLERAVLLARGNPLSAEHFSCLQVQAPVHSAESVEAGLGSLELEHIKRVLGSFGGDAARAAKALGISRATLYRKLKKIGN
jgi:DNA-binding NtrC family response regulator